jgi:hypothetical protein
VVCFCFGLLYIWFTIPIGRLRFRLISWSRRSLIPRLVLVWILVTYHDIRVILFILII